MDFLYEDRLEAEQTPSNNQANSNYLLVENGQANSGHQLAMMTPISSDPIVLEQSQHPNLATTSNTIGSSAFGQKLSELVDGKPTTLTSGMVNESTSTNSNRVVESGDAEISDFIYYNYTSDSEDAANDSMQTKIGNNLEANDSNVNTNAIVIVNLDKTSKLTRANIPNRFKCELCEYSTKRRSHLMRHNRIHTNERPYECEFCDKRFSRKDHRDRHIHTHMKMFAVQRLKRPQEFKHEEFRKSHESHYKARRFQCYLCKKVVSRRRRLLNHMQEHTSGRFPCSKCQKQFGSKVNLKRHMTVHDNLIGFQCSNCNRGFIHKTPWELHENRCISETDLMPLMQDED